jgi:hypothetical protein
MLKISPMEYRSAQTLAPVLMEPKPLFPVLEPEARPTDDVAAGREKLEERVAELEQQAQLREREFAQQVEAVRKAACDGRAEDCRADGPCA